MSKVLVLATEAQKRLQDLGEESRQLSLSLNAQNVIIDDLLQTVQGDDEAPKKKESVSLEIAAIDRRLQDANAVLEELLRNSARPASAKEIGETLRSLLQSLTDTLLGVMSKELETGSPVVLLPFIARIDRRIAEINDDLSAKGLFPETEEEFRKRKETVHSHHKRLLDFLSQAAEEVQNSE
jgi:hypothetical protein